MPVDDDPYVADGLKLGTHTRAATIPYALQEVAGAQHLIVSFPGLTVGPAPPLVDLRNRLGDLRAHRLFVGADENFLLGPGTELAGARTATHLIWHVAEQLKVPERRMITVGSSFRALCALYVGLKARCGYVVAGGPPVRFGQWIVRLHTALPPSREASRVRTALVEMTQVDRDPDRREFFDKLILRAAQRAQHEATISLFASPDDPIVDECLWLREQLDDHPSLSCELQLENYGDHSRIKLPFFAHLHRTLRPVTGTTILLRDESRYDDLL